MKSYSLREWLVVFMPLVIFFACKKSTDDIPTPNNAPLPTFASRVQINSTLTVVGKLSQARSAIAIISAANKIFFAGGATGVNEPSSRVDIYDISTNSWTTAELSIARYGIAAAVSGNKVYFAGGVQINHNFSSRLDIYNVETNTWSILEIPEYNQYLTSAAAGNKVVFAGGAKANILNVVSNKWEPPHILSAKAGEGCCPGEISGISSTVIGDSIYFAGGVGWDVHKTIDIYNVITDGWSISSLQEYKGHAAGIAVGNTNYWAGGFTYDGGEQISKLVEIRDTKSGISKIDTLFQGNAYFSAALRNDTIVYYTGKGIDRKKFDIYSISAKTWSIGILLFPIVESEIFSVNNTFYVAPGKTYGDNSDRLWKLDF